MATVGADAPPAVAEQSPTTITPEIIQKVRAARRAAGYAGGLWTDATSGDPPHRRGAAAAHREKSA